MPQRRRMSDSDIRARAIENCIREKFGLDPLPPVTRLYPVSLDSTASGSGDLDLPPAPRARGSASIVLMIPAALAGMLFAAVVVLALPLGNGTLDHAEAETPTPPTVAPNHTRNAAGVTIEKRSRDVPDRPVIKPCRTKVN